MVFQQMVGTVRSNPVYSPSESFQSFWDLQGFSQYSYLWEKISSHNTFCYKIQDFLDFKMVLC
jgi:hypothetical protein